MARAGLTAARLTEAAARLADEKGLDRLTVSGLAREFGVKDASLYSHVRNLRELRVRVALLAAEEMSERIALAVAGRAGKDALLAFADAYREFALAHPGRYAAAQLQFEPEEIAGSVGFARGVELTRRVLRAYGLAEPDLTDAGRLLRAAFHGYIHLELNQGFADSRVVEESWRRSLEALHITLANWPVRGGAEAST
ncbi:TetR/AcrR family transcriptional regulator [Kitasatospora sp. NPDC006697]|uniref:TetR/AcrR family transcriptional regulator n=1 Tax=Kitasatospora sp. NPDC006697 TaxID=3364020 RepID=UPI0036849D92